MNKDEKRNVIIAAILSIGAVIIIWWMRSGSPVYTADPTQTPVPDTTGAAAPAAVPGYMSYNIPPYNPALPNINYGGANAGGNTTLLGGNTTNNGKGCCPGCAGDDIGVTDNIGSFYSLMGFGSLAGAA